MGSPGQPGGHEGCWRTWWGPCPPPCSYRQVQGAAACHLGAVAGMGSPNSRHFQTALSAASIADTPLFVGTQGLKVPACLQNI